MSRDDPQVNFRLPADLRQRLVECANAGKRTLTQEIVRRLEASLGADGRAQLNFAFDPATDDAPASPVALDLGAAYARDLKSLSDHVASLLRELELQREMLKKMDLWQPSQESKGVVREAGKKFIEQQKMVDAVADAATKPAKAIAEKIRAARGRKNDNK